MRGGRRGPDQQGRVLTARGPRGVLRGAIVACTVATISAGVRGGSVHAVQIPAAGEKTAVGETSYIDLPDRCLILRSLTLRPRNIFPADDPYASSFYGRAANALHRVTRAHVIRRGLGIREGQSVCREDLEAAIRRLRAYGFLHSEIAIEPLIRGDSLDLAVTTRDVWTTRPTIDFRKDGGIMTWSLGLEEFNLLGLGKGLGIATGEDELHFYVGGWYRDPQVLGSDIQLLALAFEGEDLRTRRLEALRPLDRAEFPWGFGLEAVSYAGKFRDRRGGLDGPEWRLESWLIAAAGGWRIAGNADTALRLKPGVYLTRERYTAPTDSLAAVQGAALGPAMRSRDIRAVGVEFDLLHERYSQRTSIHTLYRREDFNLGTELRVRLGQSAERLGAAEDALYFAAECQQGLPLGPRRFLLAWLKGEGLHPRGRFDDLRLMSRIWYFQNLSRRQTFAAGLRADLGSALAPQAVYTMGAREGLRAFEAYRFWGERLLLLNLENRVILVDDLLGLLTLGVAGFVDGGVAWRAGHHAAARPRVGAGLGLRLSGSRTRGEFVTRIDLGFPLVGRETQDGALVVSIGSGPAF